MRRAERRLHCVGGWRHRSAERDVTSGACDVTCRAGRSVGEDVVRLVLEQHLHALDVPAPHVQTLDHRRELKEGQAAHSSGGTDTDTLRY